MSERPYNPLLLTTVPDPITPWFYSQISLRDLFAASALANSRLVSEMDGSQGSDKAVAAWSYGIADAMLAERLKP
jgi:hypothetical protein